MKILSISFIIFLLLVASNAWALNAGHVNAGNRLYERGKYESAIGLYEQDLKKDPESDVVNFNLGTARYKKGDYPQAIAHLQKSLLTDDEKLKEKAHYNLG